MFLGYNTPYNNVFYVIHEPLNKVCLHWRKVSLSTVNLDFNPLQPQILKLFCFPVDLHINHDENVFKVVVLEKTCKLHKTVLMFSFHPIVLSERKTCIKIFVAEGVEEFRAVEHWWTMQLVYVQWNFEFKWQNPYQHTVTSTFRCTKVSPLRSTVLEVHKGV